MSLVSPALGFWVFAMLIFTNRHQAELSGLSGGSAVAIIGGVSALLVGTVFLVAAGLHWRFCVRRPAALAVWRRSVRFDFGWPQPAMAFAVLS
jgi:hypothetical protein